MSPPKLFAVVLVAAALAVGPATTVATPGVTSTTTAPGLASTAAQNAPPAVNAPDGVTIRLEPRAATVEPGENVTVDVTVENATTGVGSYSVRVRSGTPAVAPVTAANLPEGELGRASVGAEGRSATFDVAGADRSGDSIRLGSVTVSGEAVGSSTLTIRSSVVGNRTGDRYRVADRTNASITVASNPIGVSLEPSTVRLGPDGSRTLDVVATGATEGAETFDLNVTSDDVGVAAFESGSVAGEPRLRQSRVTDDGSSVRLLAVGAGIPDDDDDGNVTLGTVTVVGNGTGEANLTLDVEAVGSGERQYTVTSTTGATVAVGNGSDVPPVVGENPPTNVDGDPQLEDVDGDGAFTVFDVQAFLETFEGDVVQSNPSAFNFDGSADGRITIFDVQALLEEL